MFNLEGKYRSKFENSKEEDKTVFTINAITSEEYQQLLNIFEGYKNINKDNPGNLSSFTKDLFEVVKIGLKSFKSKDQEEQEITEEIISKMPFKLLNELANEIMDFNQLKDTALKN